VVGLIHWDTLFHSALFGNGRVLLMPSNFDHLIEKKLPEFVGKQYRSKPAKSHPFFIVPEIEDESPHGTVGQANGTYRRVYHSGRSFRIGDEQAVREVIEGWVLIG
jgi:hypothetical protein